MKSGTDIDDCSSNYPINYPEEFYWKFKTGLDYSYDTGDQLDVNRLLNGQPYWKKVNPPSKLIKKKLIIADWRMVNWSDEKIKDVISTLFNVMMDGFEVYLWQMGESILMENGDSLLQLKHQTTRYQINLCTHETIINSAMHQHKFTRDEVQVIDDYWLDALLDNDFKRERTINSMDLLNHKTPPLDIIKILSEAEPNLQRILHTQYCYDTAISLHPISDNKDIKIPIDIHYNNIILYSHEADQLIKEKKLEDDNVFACLSLKNMNAVKQLFIEEVTSNTLKILLANINYIEKLLINSILGDLTEDLRLISLSSFTLSDECSAQTLHHILRHSYHIKNLSFANLALTKEKINSIHFSKLFSLSLMNSSFSYEVLELIFSKAKNLQEITLCFNKIIGNFPENLALQSVRKITLSQDITAVILDRIIASAPNLEILDLSGCTVSGEITNDINSSNLQKLTLPLSISASSLKYLLNKAEKLEEINFANCTINGDFSQPITLPSLTHLTNSIDAKILRVDILNFLLDNSARLKTMLLFNCGGNTTSELNLASLEHLVLSNVNIDLSLTLIDHLLAFTTNLKELIIRCAKTTRNERLNELDLRSLEVISLNGAESDYPKFSMRDIYYLMRSKKLNKLEFTQINIINDSSISFKKRNYPNLTVFNFDNIRISLNSLANIWSANLENLQEMSLINCQLEGELDPAIKFSWPSLTKLNLSYTQLSWDSLSILIAKAPNLKELTLTHSPIDIDNLKAILKGITLIEPISNLDHTEPALKRTKDILEISADTSYQKTTFNLNQIFVGGNENPNPADYRLAVKQYLNLDSGRVNAEEAFFLSNAYDIEFTNTINNISILPTKSKIDLVNKFKTDSVYNKNLYYGSLQLQLDSEWQTLPSLSSEERILEYHIDNPMMDCEIQYSLRDNLYYIRSKDKNAHSINFDFLLDSRPNKRNSKSTFSVQFPKNLKNLIQFYQYEFGVGAHSFKGPGTGREFLDAINRDKKGACGIRSLALMDAITRFKEKGDLSQDISCRFISNDCHAFVEIQLKPGEPWIAYDLGGYVAELNIHKKNIPESLAKTNIAANQDFNIQLLIEENNDKYTVEYFIDLLTNKNETNAHKSNPKQFLEHLVNGEKKKQLINLSSTAQVQALALSIEDHCHATSRKVYYIHSADDLICSSAFVKRKSENSGVLTNGPGGELYDFLIENRDNKVHPPVLIVNYDNFTADDIVRLNALLDKKPKADGTEINETLLIGLINPNKPGSYNGKDFTDRFGKGNILACPFSATSLMETQSSDECFSHPVSGDIFTINLFHAADWKERLLGRWKIKKDGFYFEEGLLDKALKSGLAIEIQNGLWNDPDFCLFWNRKKIDPLKAEGYDWETLGKYVQFDNAVNNDAHVLNPTKLRDCFYQYECIDKTLDTKIGLVESHRNGKLELNLTRELSDDEWAELLTECVIHNVKLHCHILPSVDLPEALSEISVIQMNNSLNQDIYTEYNVIESTDVDVTISDFIEFDSYLIIDVSELTGNDLLTNLSGEVIKGDSPRIEFTEKMGALLTALSGNKKVILRGKFSPELADALSPHLLKTSSNLILVTPDASNLKFASVYQNVVNIKDKLHALSLLEFPDEQFDSINFDDSFANIRARLLSPHLLDPWQGLAGLSGNINIGEFNPKKSEKRSRQFIQDRRDSINKILEHSPYVFITGITGAGKSTFIENNLDIDKKHLYIGEQRILDWANDQSEGRKILFIDEANIGTREWSEFYGLFNDPPTILINGEIHTLTPEHKVIFAGNPLNYGGERSMAPFFADNGQALVFEPLSSEFIYEEILKPIFINTNAEKFSLKISEQLLKIYKFLCDRSSDEVLISPRELEMMALLIMTHAEKYPDDDLIAVSKHYQYLIARDLVPEKYIDEFNRQFLVSPLKKPLMNVEKLTDYVLTPSRESLYQYLTDLVDLSIYREKLWMAFKDTDEKDWPKDVKKKFYGGLGGIVIEGESGIGKSELVTAHLQAQKKQFDFIPVSMGGDEKKEKLDACFNQGEFCIVDEINSAPMMERKMNALLMHKMDDNSRPKKPGSMIVATQNPVTMAGRIKPSNAQKRRTTLFPLPEYPDDERVILLTAAGVEQKYAERMTEAARRTQSTTRAMLSATEKWKKIISTTACADEKQIIYQSEDISKKTKSRKHTFFDADVKSTSQDNITEKNSSNTMKK